MIRESKGKIFNKLMQSALGSPNLIQETKILKGITIEIHIKTEEDMKETLAVQEKIEEEDLTVKENALHQQNLLRIKMVNNTQI